MQNGEASTPAPAGRPLYRYRFGAAEFDETRFELRVGGLVTELELKPLEVLLELLRHAGEVLTKEELFDSVWAGRITVENVLANAITKLRKALGEAQAASIITVPRIGYRLDGNVERIAVGRAMRSTLALNAGQSVPGRPHFVLEAQLAHTLGAEVWRARHNKTGELRVYKFSLDGERLPALKREATLARVLRQSLGERRDFVRVIDWNFESAPFFLECEYGGDSLGDWAAAGHLARASQDARLQLFVAIADALAAAHSVGVLHKDLKPANVLVAAEDDGHWRVRLTDFGSGRLLEPGRLQELGITQLGMTVTQNLGSDSSSGTPLYLAPEVIAGQSPTVQSDVYSLGVMLYQLLSGDFRTPMTPGWERLIDDELLREDIAAATDGNPARRLANAAELAERLRTREARAAERKRQQQAEQRATVAERALERSRARRPWLLGALAALGLGLSVSLWFYFQSLESQRQLAHQYQVARTVNRFMAEDLIGAANPSVIGRPDVTVIEAAKAAIPKIDASFGADSPDIQAALHHALQEALTGLIDYDTSVSEGRKAVAAYRKAQPSDIVALSEASIRLAWVLSKLGQYQEASAILDGVEKDLPQIADPHPDVQIKFWEALSELKNDQLDIKASAALDRKAWALMQTLPDAPADFRERIEFNLADSLRMSGELKESEALLRDVIVSQNRSWGPTHWKPLFTSLVLANNLLLQRRLDEAAQLVPVAVKGIEAALGAGSGRTLMAKSMLAEIYMNQRKFAQAALVAAEVYKGKAEKYGDNSQTVIAALNALAAPTQYAGDPIGAEALYRRALAAARTSLGEDNPQTQGTKLFLADCLLQLGRAEEAAPLLVGLRSEDLKNSTLREDSQALLDYEVARVALARGDASSALALLQKASGEVDGKPVLWDDLPHKLEALLREARLHAQSQARFVSRANDQ